MSPKVKKEFLKPKEISVSQSKKILDFLNTVETAEEIVKSVKLSKKRTIGIKVAESILKSRSKVGKFTSLRQVSVIPEIGPKRFTDIAQMHL